MSKVKPFISLIYSNIKRRVFNRGRKGSVVSRVKGSAEFDQRPEQGRVKKFISEDSTIYGCSDFLVERVSPSGKGYTRFLFDSRSGNCPHRGLFIYAQSRKEILFSDDNAKTWVVVAALDALLPDTQQLSRFYAGSHCFVIQTKDPVETIVLDMNFSILSRESLNGYHWHGTQGLGESNIGVIMFSEYQSVDEGGGKVSVWRLRPPYTGKWQRVLEKEFGRYPEGDVRHFHTCIPDPSCKSRWYLSSGDFFEHVKIWVTNDDGDSWEQLSCILSPNGLLGEEFKDIGVLARFTSAIVSHGRLLWPTDDSLGIGRSAIVSAQISGAVARLEVLDLLGVNLLRNIVKLPVGYFVISESKDDVRFVDTYVLSEEGRVKRHFPIPNVSGKSTSVTDSIGSIFAEEGRFYFPNNGALSVEKGGVIRFSLMGTS
ncbi:hypothetical protein [Stutzerimonas balearica]|uniref:hypothetical protein n=1 Tax=Stutzerimonas balearica TaxID=74829 RepID=UPI00289D615E|nr:hypothetical protein [Stutzerimonas balearica]